MWESLGLVKDFFFTVLSQVFIVCTTGILSASLALFILQFVVKFFKRIIG